MYHRKLPDEQDERASRSEDTEVDFVLTAHGVGGFADVRDHEEEEHLISSGGVFILYTILHRMLEPFQQTRVEG